MPDVSFAGRPLAPYYHVCALLVGAEEEDSVLTPFFREGLERGERVFNIVDPARRDAHLRRFAGAGIDVERCERERRLEVRTWDEVYLRDGHFCQDRMLSAVDGVIEEGRALGFERHRLSGNMGWALLDRPGTEQLIEYEVRINEVLARTRQPAFCIYDITRLSGALVMDILRSHPLTLVGGVLHENPLYVPPARFLAELRARRGAVSAVPA
ncbi:MAG: MEDS domain-containing protein [Planctomycetes bacterium]|nr:MEDS domain-containing protein [Planctomycetota bacterium]